MRQLGLRIRHGCVRGHRLSESCTGALSFALRCCAATFRASAHKSRAKDAAFSGQVRLATWFEGAWGGQHRASRVE